MNSLTNPGNTSKELYFFESRFDVPNNFSGICEIKAEIKTKDWYLNGLLHRINGPAVEWVNGDKAWYIHGKLHRIDGPAIERANGKKEWFLNGKRHRTDGPAVEYSDGSKSWFIHGKRHRTDGPAIEHVEGDKAWYLNHQRYGINNDFNTQSWRHFQKTLLF